MSATVDQKSSAVGQSRTEGIRSALAMGVPRRVVPLFCVALVLRGSAAGSQRGVEADPRAQGPMAAPPSGIPLPEVALQLFATLPEVAKLRISTRARSSD